ncbi:MAG: helix-turn-helix domain-containing protein [Halobacteriales archaeon]|nr:helix-turn-helix domain-containing protein [Halobacteriales archaeon]
MRFTTVVLRHPEGWFQSAGEAFADCDAVAPVGLHSLRTLADGTAVMLYELEGDADAVREVLSENAATTDHRVTKRRDRVAAYIHFDPTPTVERLAGIPEKKGLVVETPMEFEDDGGLEATLVGPEANLRDALAQVPERVEVSVVRVGSYSPGSQSLTRLSERQREVLRTAHELGYYRQPRRATHEEIAEELDCTAANVGEILRRVENALVDEAVGGSAPRSSKHGINTFS